MFLNGCEGQFQARKNIGRGGRIAEGQTLKAHLVGLSSRKPKSPRSLEILAAEGREDGGRLQVRPRGPAPGRGDLQEGSHSQPVYESHIISGTPGVLKNVYPLQYHIRPR